MSKKDISDVLIIGVDFCLRDEDCMTIMRKKDDGTLEAVNTLTNEEARELYDMFIGSMHDNLDHNPCMRMGRRCKYANSNKSCSLPSCVIPIGDLHSVPHYRCPNCYKAVVVYKNDERPNHCPWCGQSLLWDY